MALDGDGKNPLLPQNVTRDMGTSRHHGPGVVQTNGDQTTHEACCWKPPDPGTVKINIDAAFLSPSGQSYAGAIGRDHRGLAYFSLSQKMMPCTDVEEAEARALLAGLNCLESMYKGPIIAETDCAFLAN